MAPCSVASRVIPRITDSVKPCVRRAVRMTAKDTVLTGSLDGGQFAGCEVPPQAMVRPAGSGPRASRVGPSFDTRKMPRRVRASPLGPNRRGARVAVQGRSEEHTSELQSPDHLVCRLLLEKKKKSKNKTKLTLTQPTTILTS